MLSLALARFAIGRSGAVVSFFQSAMGFSHDLDLG
jgi:hypothetical protein